MKTNLPESITTIEEAEAFLSELHENGESFNPDDAAQDVAWPIGKHPNRYELTKLNILMNEVLNVDGFDAYDYLLELENENERINNLARPEYEEPAATQDLSDKIIAFEKAFIELSKAWTQASPESSDALQNTDYPFELSLDDYLDGVKKWSENSVTALTALTQMQK